MQLFLKCAWPRPLTPVVCRAQIDCRCKIVVPVLAKLNRTITCIQLYPETGPRQDPVYALLNRFRPYGGRERGIERGVERESESE